MTTIAQVTEPPPSERPTLKVWAHWRTDIGQWNVTHFMPTHSETPAAIVVIPGTKLAAALEEERAALEACANECYEVSRYFPDAAKAHRRLVDARTKVKELQ